MDGVLAGIRVLEISRYISGPYCGALLADMGAEVWRIEPPQGEIDRTLGPFAPNGESLPVITLNRNKKGITLNLPSPKGQEVLQELVKRVDVVLHNLSVDAAETLGLSYPALKEINPGVVLVSITGFGLSGPYAHRVGFDSTGQSLSGAMSFTGFPGNAPVKAGVPYVDVGTAIYAALGAMFALYHRQETGKGQLVDIALLDSAITFMQSFAVAAEYKLTGNARQPLGNQAYYAFSNCFPAKDGWVFISAVSNRVWKRLAQALGKAELTQDPRFSSDYLRFQHRDILNSWVSGWVADKTVDQAIALLEKKRVPCGKVNTVAEVVTDPQVKAREMLIDMEYPGIGKVTIGGVCIKLSETPGTIAVRAPLLGEHNEEVYCGLLGYSAAKLAQLRAEGVI